MVEIRKSCRAAGPRAPRSSPAFWIATTVTAALLVSLAVAAAGSGGLDRLLPKDQPFLPYFTS